LVMLTPEILTARPRCKRKSRLFNQFQTGICHG
jgi:hypothetical protein